MSVDLPVERIMKRDLLECSPSMSVREASKRMCEAGCGSIVVVDEGRPVGIWTESDALSGAWHSTADLDQPVSTFMSTPVQSIPAQTTLGEATRHFRLAGVRHFLVNDDQGHHKGIISQTDVVRSQGVAFFMRARIVGSLIQEPPNCVEMDTSFGEVRQLMLERNLDAVIVRSGEHYGIITKRDVVGALSQQKIEANAGELASFPLVTIRHDATLLQARDVFIQNHIRHLGLMDDQQMPIGLLTFRDLFDTVEHEYVNGLLPELELQTERLLQSQREIARQVSLTDAILNALPINVFVKDEKGRLIIANEMSAKTTGRPLAEIIGRTDDELFPPEVAKRLLADDARVRSANQTLVREELLDDGRTLLARKCLVQVDGAELLIGASMDVTDWKRADALMVSSHHVLELIAGGSELTVVLETLCKRMETHLPGSSCSILLLDADGQHLRHAAAPSLPETYALAVDRVSIGPSAGSCGAAAFLGEQVIVEDIANSPLWADRLDFAKQYNWRACWSTPFFSAARKVLGTFAISYPHTKRPDYNDLMVITHATRMASVAVERWQQITELQRLATTDQLTDLSNRAHFMDNAEVELRRAGRFNRELVVLMIDIDLFKQINDRHGHATGDEALRVFSRVLGKETRAFDLLGRIGGEEFAVVLPETSIEAGLQIAERLREAVEKSSFVFHDGPSISFTVSIGASRLQAGDNLDSLLARADDALYRAKHAGRNRIERA